MERRSSILQNGDEAIDALFATANGSRVGVCLSCRNGNPYLLGDTEADLARAAWYDRNSNATTHPVGQKQPNVFGLYDMYGNVGQWCKDWYEMDYYGKSEAENPPGPFQGNGSSWDPRGPFHADNRVVRGSNWNFALSQLRSGYHATDTR